MGRTLLRGGCVLTMGRTNLPEADVLIADGMIAEVGPGLRARDAEVIDASAAIVMPGFVDAHRHVSESLFRHLGDGGRGSFAPDDVYAATLLGLLAALDSGITTVADWCPVATDAATTAAALRAHRESGIRSVLVHAAGRERDGSLQAAAGERGPLTSLAAGCAEPRTAGLDAVAQSWAAARTAGLRIHTHAGATASDAGVAAALAQRGLLGPDVTLVHGTHFTEVDFDAVAAAGAAITLAPSRVMAAGGGAPPIQALVDRGIRPGLGAEDERLAPGDMFAQMRAVISLQHATVFDRKLAGKAGLPKLLTTRDVIRYGTVDGAAAAGLAGVTGTVEPGHAADLIVLRTDSPNIHPVNDPIGAVVWGMDTSNVSWVFVAGNAVKRDGELVADTARVREMAAAARDRLVAGVGSGR